VTSIELQYDATLAKWVEISRAATSVAAASKSSAYTFTLSDFGNIVESTASGAVTFTIPTDASVAFPVGTVIQVYQYGTGQVTIAPAGGVTLHTASTYTTRAQYSMITLRKRASNEWTLYGDLT
jgi:hypothetical protein